METNLVHGLPPEFQSAGQQPSFWERDLIVEDVTQVDFVMAESVDKIS